MSITLTFTEVSYKTVKLNQPKKGIPNMSTINLSEWLDSRGTFKDVQLGEVELQIVSLSSGLIVGLKALPTHEMMFDFVAEHGLSHNRMRISDNDDMREDLPIIWALPEFAEAKKDIVNAICDLNDAALILSDKKDEEELAAMEKEEEKDNVIDGDHLGDTSIPLGDLHADIKAHCSTA
jgi:hypothetical protein